MFLQSLPQGADLITVQRPLDGGSIQSVLLLVLLLTEIFTRCPVIIYTLLNIHMVHLPLKLLFGKCLLMLLATFLPQKSRLFKYRFVNTKNYFHCLILQGRSFSDLVGCLWVMLSCLTSWYSAFQTTARKCSLA